MHKLILKNMVTVSVVSLMFCGGAMAKPVRESSHNPRTHEQIAKDGTANVEKKLMWLVDTLEEQNPPDGSYNFSQMLPDSDMPDESSFSPGDGMSISDPQIDEVDSHINETADPGATPIHFQMNTAILKGNSVGPLNMTPASFIDNPLAIKPNLISATDEEPKPASKDPYDPTNEGTSKEGRHKGEHLHQQRGSVHLIPIIKMGESPEGNSGLTVIKPWNS